MFNDKIILITGGSSGIGAATALLFAEKGADIALTYISSNKKGASDVVEKIQKFGRKVLMIKADLTSDRKAKKVVEKTVKEFGRIDVLVNNAGRYIEGDEWNGHSKIWLKSLETNLLTMMNISRYVIEVFQKQKSGIMVNVSSRHGLGGHPDITSYSAAKAGVINITQTYAELMAKFGGRANSVSPWATNAGYWLTAPKEELNMTIKESPGGRLVETQTVAEKITFLASDEASGINGENFLIKE